MEYKRKRKLTMHARYKCVMTAEVFVVLAFFCFVCFFVFYLSFEILFEYILIQNSLNRDAILMYGRKN